MPATTINSAVFRDIFSTEAMRKIFSDESRIQKYLDFEGALARAQARLGIIPQEAADEICRHCNAAEIDYGKLKIQTERIGYPVLPAVQQLVALCRDGLGEWCHWGATTQDITDSATVMQIREALVLVEADLDAIADALAGLARKYRDTPMAGRSNLQQAVPITFGYKMATLLAAFERHKQRLAELRARVLVGEFGGAAGTLSSLGGRGLEVQAELMKELKLGRAGDRLAHGARHHRRGRLFSRPRHRHLRQDRVRRQADDADRGGGALRAVPRRPRLDRAPCRRSATRSPRSTSPRSLRWCASRPRRCSTPWSRTTSARPDRGRSSGSCCRKFFVFLPARWRRRASC